MSSTETFTPSSTNARSRKKTILLSALGVAIAVGFGIMTYSILVTPSRQPYRDAAAQYKNVYNANIAIMTAGSSLNANSATDEQFNKNLTIVSNTLDALETETKQLGTQTVLKTGEGKTLYDTFNKKATTYIAYNRDIVTSMKEVRPIIYACSQTMTNLTETEASATAMQNCANNLQDLQNVPDADYAELATASQSIYADIASTIKQRAELADPEGADAAADKTLSDKQNELLASLNTVSTTFSTNLSKHKQAVDITDAAKALDEYLSKKASVF